MDIYGTPGIPPGTIRRWSRWVDAGDRATKYLVVENSPPGAYHVPVRVVTTDGTHPAAGMTFYLSRADLSVRLRPVIG
jgi:hypothetical protein